MELLIALAAAVFAGAAVIFTALQWGASRRAANEAQLANRKASRANLIAKQANLKAERANELSGEANEIARGSAERSIERHEVDWDGSWNGRDAYVLVNRGAHAALQVRAVVTINNDRVEETADSVPPGGTLVLRMPRTQKLFDAERQRRMRIEDKAVKISNASFPEIYTVSEYVGWESEHGVPHQHKNRRRSTYPE